MQKRIEMATELCGDELLGVVERRERRVRQDPGRRRQQGSRAHRWPLRRASASTSSAWTVEPFAAITDADNFIKLVQKILTNHDDGDDESKQ